MAREATITQEQVNAVADAIRASGIKPTARAVRDQLGTGSMATVLKLLQVWQAGQVKAAETPITLPVGLQRALVDFVGQEIATAKASLQADLVNLQQANNDLIAENERQASTLEIQSEAFEVTLGEKAELVGRLSQVESDLARSVDEVAVERQAAEAARTELAKALLRLEAVPRIEAEIERLRIELVDERKARTDAEQKAAVATAQLEAATRRADVAEQREQTAVAKAEHASVRVLELEKQSQAATGELTQARVQVQAQQTALDAQARELAEFKAMAKEARNDAKKSVEEAAELRGRLAEVEGSRKNK